MAPGHQAHQPYYSKGRYYIPTDHVITDVPNDVTTIKSIMNNESTLSTMINATIPSEETIISTMNNATIPSDETIISTMNNATIPLNETMISTMNNATITANEVNNTFMMNATNFNENNNFITEMFNTSFEQITTTLNTNEMDDMHNSMGHYDEHSDYNYLLFIILGVVLGILIVVGAILAVIYTGYKRRGFHEIAGTNKEHCEPDPQSMVQIEQEIQKACSEDTLIDKK